MSYIFLYGKPGSGKSTLAASFTNLGYSVLFHDIDRKVNQMSNLADRVKSRQIIVQEVTAKLVEGTMRQRITSPSTIPKQPRGYLEVCDFLDSLEADMVAGKQPPADVLVEDSLSSTLEHLDRLMKFTSKKDHFEFTDWAIWKSNLEEYFYKLIGMTEWFKHVVVIAHEQLERDELTGKIDVLPLIDGSMKNKVAKYFPEVYHTEVSVGKDNSVTYMVRTVADQRYTARTSRNLDVLEDSDMATIFADELVSNKAKKGGSNGKAKAK